MPSSLENKKEKATCKSCHSKRKFIAQDYSYSYCFLFQFVCIFEDGSTCILRLSQFPSWLCYFIEISVECWFYFLGFHVG